jgi:uncharacterized RDD family membrane protein YckC
MKSRNLEKSLKFGAGLSALWATFELVFGYTENLLIVAFWGGILGFFASLIFIYIRDYPHAGWKRLALVLSPVLALFVLFYWHDEYEVAPMAIATLLLFGPLILFARDLFMWVSNGFSEQETVAPNYSLNILQDFYRQCAQSVDLLVERITTQSPKNPNNKTITVIPGSVKNSAWSVSDPHPWRRYFARSLDTSIHGVIVLFVVAIVLGTIAPETSREFFGALLGTSGQMWFMMLYIFAATFLTAAMIGFTGSSLGKWMFGIKVTDKQDRPIGYKTAWNRELKIWVRGFGLGLPIISLFTLWSAYQYLKKENKTTWDDELGLKVNYRENNSTQAYMSILGVILIFILFLAPLLVAAKYNNSQELRNADKAARIRSTATTQADAKVSAPPSTEVKVYGVEIEDNKPPAPLRVESTEYLDRLHINPIDLEQLKRPPADTKIEQLMRQDAANVKMSEDLRSAAGLGR